jgi:hypothetical protein
MQRMYGCFCNSVIRCLGEGKVKLQGELGVVGAYGDTQGRMRVLAGSFPVTGSVRAKPHAGDGHEEEEE